MVKYNYILLGVVLIVLLLALTFIGIIEIPLAEKANLPRCDNNVIIDTDLRYDILTYANERIIQGTGDSYFNNHFIYKNLDYSTVDCLFTVRYEYTYDELHSDMDISLKAFSQDNFEIIRTNTFLRPVGILVSGQQAVDIAEQQEVTYSYYNLEIDVEQQTFKYKFYEESFAQSAELVLTIDAQSKEITRVKATTQVIPIV